MPRNGSAKDIVWFDIDPCYIYHTMNAYEDGDEVVLDGCRLIGYMAVGMVKPPLPTLCQWRMNLKTGAVSTRQIDDLGVDFPSALPIAKLASPIAMAIPANSGRARPRSRPITNMTCTLAVGLRIVCRMAGLEARRCLFQRKAATSEDDGYLLSYVYDPAEDKSELVILDASNIANDPVARVHLPARVPAGFHGSWIGDSDMTERNAEPEGACAVRCATSRAGRH